MRKPHLLPLLAGALVLSVSGLGQAQNLLINGVLDDPDVHETNIATGWVLQEGPFIPGTPPLVPDFNPDTASFARFADHTSSPAPAPGDGVGRGLWLRAFTGSAAQGGNQVFAHLTQTVPGTPGAPYQMSAWSLFETHYAGGVDRLNADMTESIVDSMDGLDSPTDTFLALEFLDAANSVLPGSVEIELRADGQTNGAGWGQHFLSATAPAGTVLVQVRGSMIDGVANPAANPQSAFLDDFSLSVIPEPATMALGLLGVLGLLGLVRRR
jgi:PEP-CTERM motif